MLNGTQSTGTKAAIYARTAVQCQDQLERQIKLCREVAELKGWIIPPEYVCSDFGASAAIHANRPALLKLLLSAKQHPRPFDYVLVKGVSRFARSEADLELIIELFEQAGVRVYFVDEHIKSRQEDC